MFLRSSVSVRSEPNSNLIQSELTNLIRVTMQKRQSCFLIHFELVGAFDPLLFFSPFLDPLNKDAFEHLQELGVSRNG